MSTQLVMFVTKENIINVTLIHFWINRMTKISLYRVVADFRNVNMNIFNASVRYSSSIQSRENTTATDVTLSIDGIGCQDQKLRPYKLGVKVQNM